ncbi:hypothetical protein ABK040_013873 [Willaertia magna]
MSDITKKISLFQNFKRLGEEEDTMGEEDDHLNSGQALNTINNFQFHRDSAPGMADLFRRLYNIRVECGAIPDTEKQGKEEMERQAKALKKLDKFEKQKVYLKQAIDQAESLINQKKKSSQNDPRLNNDINKAIMKMDKEMKELDKIHNDALNKKSMVWGKVQMPTEMRKQREMDIKNFKEYIKFVKAEHRKLLTGVNDDDDDKIGKKGNVKFDSIESLEQAKNEIPTVDISEGLQQIEDLKRQQEEKIDILLGQITKIKGIAESISDELDKQSQLLDKMSEDVDLYNKTLEDTNKKLAEAIDKAGGATRLLCIACVIIIVVALLGVVWLLLELFVPGLGLGLGG